MKSVLRALRIPIDLILLLAAIPSALILLVYRKLGSATLPLTTAALKKIGLFPIRAHYYEPLFRDSELSAPLSDDRNLPGIDWNISGQLELLDSLTFRSELIDMNWQLPSTSAQMFHVDNGSFASGDAEFLYQFLRLLKPRRIVEIGSGHSTKVAVLALRRNRADSGIAATHTCVEPYEMDWLESFSEIEVVRKRVEDCDFDWAKELADGDLLFVDSSHMIRPQGDVLKEYLEIIPQLASGVYIHVHDIFTPKDYPRGWVVDDVKFWNEQYLLEAVLSNGSRYQVTAALNQLKHAHYDSLKVACPYLTPDREPGSFYFKVR